MNRDRDKLLLDIGSGVLLVVAEGLWGPAAGYLWGMARKEQLTDETVEELTEDAAIRNPDETTRREALELDLEERGRSEEGEEVGDTVE